MRGVHAFESQGVYCNHRKLILSVSAGESITKEDSLSFGLSNVDCLFTQYGVTYGILPQTANFAMLD